MASTTISFSSAGYNGLMDWLGRDKGTTTWAHPETTRGYLTSTESSVNASLNAHNLFDQSASTSGGRFHSLDDEGEYWMMDLGTGCGIDITHYALQGQGHSSNHPRNWVFLGSADGVDWVLLDSQASTTLPGNASWFDQSLSTDGTYFRYFKMIQIGNNSSGSDFFVLGEVELYGTYSDELSDASAPATITRDFYSGMEGGEVGIFDALGRNKTVFTTWAHPETSRAFVTTSQSSDQDPAYTSDKAIDIAYSGSNDRSHTQDLSGSWWKADFGSSNSVIPTYLGIKGQGASANDMPRNFVIEGSNNDSDWDTLYTATSEGPTQSAWWHADMSSNTDHYRYIRIRMTGTNSSARDFLVMGEVELYGEYGNPALLDSGNPNELGLIGPGQLYQ